MILFQYVPKADGERTALVLVDIVLAVIAMHRLAPVPVDVFLVIRTQLSAKMVSMQEEGVLLK